MKTHSRYQYDVWCVRQLDRFGTSAFTANFRILDAAGNEVTTVEGTHVHEYAEAAEDEAATSACRMIEVLESGTPAAPET